ncbi:hypothetical protein [Lactiplantibacillus plantarum]|uniref:hypothetical protein n=1 Tax=Lactiplantibacillus plantarum TaxID=1590 RepID=UPI00240E8B0C|nr:hypothetical protein [Lactiplantibacillus plantarum]MDG2544928.1 hypothetical protein [Lactiplantibacillus plantarum]
MDKEILYLNNNLVNSLLAQHNKGLVSGISSEEASQNTMVKKMKLVEVSEQKLVWTRLLA